MTKRDKLTIEASEVRQKLNVLLALDEMSDEQRTELGSLSTRMGELEVEVRAEVLANPQQIETRTEGNPEDRALRELTDLARISDIFTASIEHRSTDGPTRELQQHYHLAANQIPLALLEERAVTPAPSSVGQNQAAIIPGVFPQSCASFLGVDMPTVAVGEAIFPVLTTNASAGTPAENDAQAETTGEFSADVLSPSRIQASFFYSREDRSRFQGMDEALRQNLSMALMDKLDQQILNGSKGLLNGTVLSNHDVSSVTDFAAYLKEFVYGRVDGVYASVASDVRMVVGAGTYAHMGSVYRNTSVDRSVLDRLMEISGGVKVSAHVPPVASKKQNSVIARGMGLRHAVAPIWQGISLVPDEITLAAKGQIKITAIMLVAVKLLRADGFYKQQSQHP